MVKGSGIQATALLTLAAAHSISLNRCGIGGSRVNIVVVWWKN